MKKGGILFKLRELKQQVENGEYGEDMEEKRALARIKVIDILLDYLNQPMIREAVEDVPL